MKQYIYSPAEAGLSAWPSGELRLEDIEVTTNPEEADVFVCPGNIRIFETTDGSGILSHEKLYRLPYLKGNEARTAFFDVSDNFRQPVMLPILFIKCDARDWFLNHDTGTIQMAWPVENYAECVDVPSGGFLYDVSSQAWMSTQTRIDAVKSCQYVGNLKCDVASYKDFTGYIYDKPEGIRRRAEFRRSMRESRIALCGESIPGVLPYRFFEALSAGRVPMLVSSGYVLPWESSIPYDDFILRCESRDASQVGLIIREFLSHTTDEKLIEMGRTGRVYWEALLNRDDWPRTMALAVQNKLRQMATS